MIALDTNVLVYAHRRDSPFHQPASRAVAGLAESGAPWAVPWPCFGEFFSVTTNPRAYDPPSSTAQAIEQIDAWMTSPALVTLGETAATWSALRSLLWASGVRGPRVQDARIAALCMAHGVRELWTADRDYGRFPSLRTRNPLVPA